MNTETSSIPFLPPPLLRNPHVQILAARYRPRHYLLSGVSQEDRFFQVAPQSQIRAVCSWQIHPEKSPAVILVHGLEGCHESHYMRGLAHKAWHAGFNVIRFNQRNCAGTEHLTKTWYNEGLSNDVRAVVVELAEKDGMDAVCVVGYSLGGNLILKMVGEARGHLPTLRGVAAVCPNIHPAACAEALQQTRNWVYHQNFLLRLKARLQRKAQYFPGKWDLSLLKNIRTLSQFDDVFTAPEGGYQSAADYYEQTGSRHVLGEIKIPTLIITAQDDPFIPYWTFDMPAIRHNPFIQFIAPTHGGHCGFIQRPRKDEDIHWAENRIVEFIQRAVEL